MFTGIIETTATVSNISTKGSNKTFRICCPLANQLKIDQSVAHNGVCLTVEAVEGDEYTVTAIAETLAKTNLGDWKTGYTVNLERCLQPTGRLDGHFVQGHIDTTGQVMQKKDMDGSWEFIISFPAHFAALIIEKGAVAVNGISLTAFNVTENSFTVAIIPYTYQHTNLQFTQTGQAVNLEFDMIGKYILRGAQLEKKGNVL